jgi:hypothetical protein
MPGVMRAEALTLAAAGKACRSDLRLFVKLPPPRKIEKGSRHLLVALLMTEEARHD